MHKAQSILFLAELAQAFTASVTTNLYAFTDFYDHLADGQGFDPGTSMALGPECEEFNDWGYQTPEVSFDWGQDIAIKTVYLMGSVKYNNDLIGLQMQI